MYPLALFWNPKHNQEVIYNQAYHDGCVALASGDLSNERLPMAYKGNYAYWFGYLSTGNFLGTQDEYDLPILGGTSVQCHAKVLLSPVIDLSQAKNPV